MTSETGEPRVERYVSVTAESLRSAAGVAGLMAFHSNVADPDEGPSGGPTLELLRGPRALDPVTSGVDFEGVTVMSLALEGPLRLSENGEIEPCLAVEEFFADPLTYILRFRPDVRFWNGELMTSEDVVFSLERNRAREAATSNLLASISSVRALDPHTVEIKLERQDNLLRAGLAQAPGFVIQADFARRARDAVGGPDVLTMGTGPFKIVSFSPAKGAILERHAGYWGQTPPFESVRVVVVPKVNSGGSPNGSGDAGETPHRTSSGRNRQDRDTLWVALLGMNVQSEPWADSRIRFAVALAVDRDRLVQAAVGPDLGEVASAHPAPDHWSGLLDARSVRKLYGDLPRWSRDVERARKELKASSRPGGFSETLSVPREIERLTAAAHILAENLAEIGIKIDVHEVTEDEWLATWLHSDKRESRLHLMLLNPTVPDPIDHLRQTLASNEDRPHGVNAARYSNRVIDAAIERYLGTADRSERIKLLLAIQTRALEDLPYLPLWWEKSPPQD